MRVGRPHRRQAVKQAVPAYTPAPLSRHPCSCCPATAQCDLQLEQREQPAPPTASGAHLRKEPLQASHGVLSGVGQHAKLQGQAPWVALMAAGWTEAGAGPGIPAARANVTSEGATWPVPLPRLRGMSASTDVVPGHAARCMRRLATRHIAGVAPALPAGSACPRDAGSSQT